MYSYGIDSRVSRLQVTWQYMVCHFLEEWPRRLYYIPIYVPFWMSPCLQEVCVHFIIVVCEIILFRGRNGVPVLTWSSIVKHVSAGKPKWTQSQCFTDTWKISEIFRKTYLITYVLCFKYQHMGALKQVT